MIFAPDVIKDLDWKVAQYTFPLTVPLVSMETYAYHTLLGLAVSVGGLTESTVSSGTLISLSCFLRKDMLFCDCGFQNFHFLEDDFYYCRGCMSVNQFHKESSPMQEVARAYVTKGSVQEFLGQGVDRSDAY